MCSIIASFNKQKIKDLVILNHHRGNFSYSIGVFDTDNYSFTQIIKEFGVFDITKLDQIEETSNSYIVCHIQAPTGGLIKDEDRIHPTKINDTYLWHNGIITNAGVQYIQNLSGSIDTFDTALLHEFLDFNQFSDLSNIEGLFSCLFIEHREVFLFRTKHGKLFIDADLTISSERFENSKCINYDTVYSVSFKEKSLIIVDTFKTKKFNIVVKGEL
jgi:hypothetical protein